MSVEYPQEPNIHYTVILNIPTIQLSHVGGGCKLHSQEQGTPPNQTYNTVFPRGLNLENSTLRSRAGHPAKPNIQYSFPTSSEFRKLHPQEPSTTIVTKQTIHTTQVSKVGRGS